MIRDYIIKDKLGTGSYGVVYKVTKKKDNNFYVLKQISLFGLTPSQIKDVKTEAELLSQMNSAYVVKYYDSFEEKNFLNIVMEFCDGGDLGRFLNYQMKTGRLLKEDVIWKLFIKICIGLGYLHKKKVLHRDLKSLNIFLTKGLDVKIGDLGVAKSLTQSGFAKTFIGTPYYLSPEICEEKPYNEKSDVWALGCILYEMCTYNHPFEAKTQAGLILKILKGKYQPIPSSYSYHLQKMIDLLLEKDYRKRPNVSDLFNRSIMIQKVKYNNLFDKALEVFPDIIDKEPSHHSGNNSEVPRSSSGIKHLKIVDKKPNRKVESEVKPVIKKSNANNNKLHHPQKEIIKMANRLNLGGVKIQMNRDGREGGLGCIAIPQNNKKEELPKKVLHKKIKIVDKKDSPDKKVDKKKVSGNVKFTIDKEKMKEAANQLGISYDELWNMAAQQAKIGHIERAVNGKNLSEEQKSFLANTAQYDTAKGDWYITKTDEDGNQKKVYFSDKNSNLSEELKTVQEQSDVAKATFNDVHAIRNSLDQYVKNRISETRTWEEATTGIKEKKDLALANTVDFAIGRLKEPLVDISEKIHGLMLAVIGLAATWGLGQLKGFSIKTLGRGAAHGPRHPRF